jgi:hypothetical protein
VYAPRWELRGFDVLPAAARCSIVLAKVKALVHIDQIEWRAIHPPPLYDAGITYAFQGVQDDWKDLERVCETGEGSCNSLSAWRVAELLENGVSAGPYIRTAYQHGSEGPLEVFHVIVWRALPGGGRTYEDPSARLGMPVP